MKITCQSEYGTLQTVFIKKAADAFVNQDAIHQQWKDLNFVSEPDFIRAQNEATPNVFYSQNDWVNLNHYQTVEKEELIQLWALLNRQICRIIKHISAENLESPCYFKVEGVVQIVPLSYVIEDYMMHLKHHLGHIVIALSNN